MKKQENTKEYIKTSGILLVSAIFALSLPVLALAQYDDSTSGGYIDYSTSGGYVDSSTSGGYVDYSTYGGYVDTSTSGGYVDTSTYGGYIDTSTSGGYIDYSTSGGYVDTPTSGGYVDYSTSGGYVDTPTSGGYIDYATSGGYVDTPTSGGYVDVPTSGGYIDTPTSGGYYGGSYGGGYSYPYSSYGYGSSAHAGGYYGGVPATPSFYVPSGQSAVSSGGFYGGTVASYSTYIPQVTTTYVPPVQNQVLAFNDTPTLTSVALSDVPYTGAGDVLKVILFATALTVWSMFMALMFLKRKAKRMETFAFSNAVEEKEPVQKNAYSENFSNSANSDTEALDNLGNYARAKKVLLSSDASVKLIKLQRLEHVNVAKIINKISGGEWIAVGEKDLALYM